MLEKPDLSADQCIAFEDSGNSILSSTGAGLKTIVTINDYTRGHDLTNAVLVLDRFGEPDKPCKALQGAPLENPYLDVAQIHRLFAADYS